MKPIFMAIALILTPALDVCAQPSNSLTPKQIQTMNELRKMVNLMRNTYLWEFSPGIESTVELCPDRPPFLLHTSKDKTIPFDQDKILQLSSSLTASLTPEVLFDRAITQFTFAGTISVNYDNYERVKALCSTETIHLLPTDPDEQTLSTTLLSDPIEKLGGYRLLIISNLRDTKGQLLRFDPSTPTSAYLCLPQLKDNRLSIAFELYTRFPVDTIRGGSLQMQLLAPTAYLTTAVPLTATSKGKTFLLDSIPFTLRDFGPGDVLITTDTLHKEQIETWDYALYKDNQYVRPTNYAHGGSFAVDDCLLDLLPRLPFGQWLRNTAVFDPTSEGITLPMIESYQRRQPTPTEAKSFHHAVGILCAAHLKKYGGEQDYNPQCQKRVAHCLEQYISGTNTQTLRRQLDKETGGLFVLDLAIEIGVNYKGINLKPDIEKINQSIDTYFANHTNYTTTTFKTLEEQLEAIQTNYRTLSLTSDDIAALFAPPTSPLKRAPGIRSIWYKTNAAVDAIVFYTPKPIDIDTSWLMQATYHVETRTVESRTAKSAAQLGWYDPNIPLDKPIPPQSMGECRSK